MTDSNSLHKSTVKLTGLLFDAFNFLCANIKQVQAVCQPACWLLHMLFTQLYSSTGLPVFMHDCTTVNAFLYPVAIRL